MHRRYFLRNLVCTIALAPIFARLQPEPLPVIGPAVFRWQVTITDERGSETFTFPTDSVDFCRNVHVDPPRKFDFGWEKVEDTH